MRKPGVVVILTAVFALLASFPAFAQNSFKFQMSSSFYAGNAKLPAGSYVITQMSGSPNLYSLDNTAGSHSVVLETRPSSKASKTKPEIVFNKYGDTDYLERVETSEGTSFDIMPGSAEKLAAKKGSPQPHRVPTS